MSKWDVAEQRAGARAAVWDRLVEKPTDAAAREKAKVVAALLISASLDDTLTQIAENTKELARIADNLTPKQ